MLRERLDFSAQGRARIWLVVAVGTLFCIAVAVLVDTFSFSDFRFDLAGKQMANNFVIPMLLAPPFFWLLMSRQRSLSIAYHELSVFASTDSLTACLNRKAFVGTVEAQLQQRSQHPRPTFAMLMIDADHFKGINDRFGHENGDLALKLIASSIKSAVRKTDFVGRIGGEEFCVFLPGCDESTAACVAERICAAIRSAPFLPDGQQRTLSVSVGGAVIDSPTTFSELFRNADERLYAAKGSGRDRVEVMRVASTQPRQAAALH